jgi:hypothetical protein
LKATLVPSGQINFNDWDTLIARSQQGSIFMETGYIKALLGDAWQGILVYKGEELQAVMPVNLRSKAWMQFALQPIFTKYWGIAFLNRTFKNTHSEYSWKKKVVNAVLSEIPQTVALDYFFHPSFDYPLPIYWKKYKLQVRYTYLIDNNYFTEEDLFSNYTDSLKNSIRTAEKNNIRIIKDSSADALIGILKKNAQSGKKMLDDQYIKGLSNLFAWCQDHSKGFSLTATDQDNQAIASSFYLQDDRYVYALAHNMLKSHSRTDALSLLVHHAIFQSVSQNLKFDFLGSMSEPFEAFNRRFGAKPVPYLNIERKNRLFRILGK